WLSPTPLPSPHCARLLRLLCRRTSTHRQLPKAPRGVKPPTAFDAHRIGGGFFMSTPRTPRGEKAGYAAVETQERWRVGRRAVKVAPVAGHHNLCPAATRLGCEAMEMFTERTARIVNAAKLHRAANRRKTGRFLAEGEDAVTAALARGEVLDLYVSETAWERFPFLQDVTGTHAHLITERAADHLSETVTHTGLFALCANQMVDDDALITSAVKNSPLIAVPVETNEPGNAGTIIRVADAFGAGGVLFAGNTVDPQGGKAVRASAGSLFNLPVARNTS